MADFSSSSQLSRFFFILSYIAHEVTKAPIIKKENGVKVLSQNKNYFPCHKKQISTPFHILLVVM
jgi:hypothetical protein